MIKKLKRRFIFLAMASLTLMLAVIVGGMNLVNYQKVVRDADIRLDVLAINSELILERSSLLDSSLKGGDLPDEVTIDQPGIGKNRGIKDNYNELYGRGESDGHSISRDEAEESRFFTVTVDDSGKVIDSNIDRISSVETDAQVYRYARKALNSNRDAGFVGDFRYNISEDDYGNTKITFLDCGRVLTSFRNYLKISVAMALLGLSVMFLVIRFFAGRIVKPVAESYEKQKQFITDAGHEIKTPLAIIKANLDLMDMELEGNADKNDLKESLGDIEDQVDRLTGLTNDLVYLSRMEENGNSLVMTEVPLSDIVSETVESFEPLAAERGKMICPEIEPLISMQGSNKELEKLISILMENAIKYSPSPKAFEPEDDGEEPPYPPEIRVSLRKEGRSALLEVWNETENELDNEMLSHVFERFYRTDESRSSQTGGHGIGLSVANAIVEAHSGKITAHTTDGHDFIVTATLPVN